MNTFNDLFNGIYNSLTILDSLDVRFISIVLFLYCSYQLFVSRKRILTYISHITQLYDKR